MKKPAEHARRAVFRFDAGPAIGGGHAIRCLALAQALSDEGWNCKIVTTEGGVQALRGFSGIGYQIAAIPEDKALDAEILVATEPNGCDLLIVDHYGWSAEQEQVCRNWAQRILVMDDLCNRRHDCDLLLDPAIGRKTKQYAGFISKNCRQLLNPGYALLRQEFAARRLSHSVEPSARAPERLFVNFGLIDTANLTEHALSALERIGFAGAIDVVMGATSPHLARVRARLANSSLRTNVHINPKNLVELMAGADLIIGAAGGSIWERCCLGLPSLVLIAAENQLLNARTLADAGACEWVMADNADELADRMAALLTDTDRLAHMASAARGITDGLGARRAAIAVAPEMTSRGNAISLRRGSMDDAELLLEWQRHPETRRYARNPRVPDPAEHRAWLRKKIQDPGCVLNIVEHDGEAAAMIRLDRVPESAQPDAFEISIYVDPNQTGKGIGQTTLRAARRLLPQATFLAHVLPDNKPSHALFQAAGYVFEGDMYVSKSTTVATEHH